MTVNSWLAEFLKICPLVSASRVQPSSPANVAVVFASRVITTVPGRVQDHERQPFSEFLTILRSLFCVFYCPLLLALVKEGNFLPHML